MSEESDKIQQDEIESLLAQAGAAKPASKPAPKPNEIEQGLDTADAPVATATATSAAPQQGSNATDDIQLLFDQAEQALASVDQPTKVDVSGITAFQLTDLGGTPANGEKATLELLNDVELDLKIELGRTDMYLEDVLKLQKGSVVTLDKLAGDPVDIYANGRLIARGEVLVLNDNFCIRVAELISGDLM